MKPQKNFWATNIKFLRSRKKISQDLLSESLGITRSKLSAHEKGQTQNPAVDDLLRFSDYFRLSIDTLLKTDLTGLSEFKLRQLEMGNEDYIGGRNMRVLTITVDKENNEHIEYVPVKAKMGYRAGHNDPEYIASLPKYSIPNLPKGKTYRIFTGTGTSMLPIKPGTDFITEYVEDWKTLNNTSCVLILKSGGADFLYKFVTYQDKEHNFLLRSLNDEAFPDYTIPPEEILEIWKYCKHITDELPEKELPLSRLMDMVKEMKEELARMKNS